LFDHLLRRTVTTKPEAVNAPPRHVAIVMDGNGRWANKRLMPRVFGHKFGVDALVRIIDACGERGIEYLTVFAFSSENWRRPPDEVSGLLNLVFVAVSKYLTRMAEKGVRIRIIGDRASVSDQVRAAWDLAESRTAHNRGITVTVAFNYGGRWDIVQAVKRAVAAGLTADQIDEQRLASFMSLAGAPELDFFIRTGGEERISNFLLWQVAYAELYFTDCLWPDFDERALDVALADYARRDRRFGGVKTDVPAAAAVQPVAAAAAVTPVPAGLMPPVLHLQPVGDLAVTAVSADDELGSTPVRRA
jgi:undecaprenyl diphosphate synthase